MSESAKHVKTLIKFATMAIIGWAVTHFLFANFQVAGPSMNPTYQSGDRIIVERISPRLGELRRDSLIIYGDANRKNQTFFKRIVGVPGDVVEIMDHQVHINGYPLENAYTKQGPPNTEPDVIPDGRYFVLGDNRERSHDSRAWPRKYISQEQIIGTCVARYWPLKNRSPQPQNPAYALKK